MQVLHTLKLKSGTNLILQLNMTIPTMNFIKLSVSPVAVEISKHSTVMNTLILPKALCGL